MIFQYSHISLFESSVFINSLVMVNVQSMLYMYWVHDICPTTWSGYVYSIYHLMFIDTHQSPFANWHKYYYAWEIHYKRPFSLAMWNYQRVGSGTITVDQRVYRFHVSDGWPEIGDTIETGCQYMRLNVFSFTRDQTFLIYVQIHNLSLSADVRFWWGTLVA